MEKSYMRWLKELKQIYVNKSEMDLEDKIDQIEYFDYWADGKSPYDAYRLHKS